MMADILTFKKREPTDPHGMGPVICMQCKHEWIGVIPVGTPPPFECPSCHCIKGILKKYLANSGALHFACRDCGEYIFSIMLLQKTPTLMCCTCGGLTNALDLFND